LEDLGVCATTPLDEIVSLSVSLSVRVRNRTEDRIILSRRPDAGSPRVAASVEAGLAGRIDFEYDFHRYWEAESNKAFGERPSEADFVIMKPGDVHTTHVGSVVFVRRKGAAEMEQTVLEGSPFAVQLPILWWSPLAHLSEPEVRELRHRWRPHGRLVLGTSRTNWVEVSMPEIGQPRDCDQPRTFPESR
jgi:hypothetical protein